MAKILITIQDMPDGTVSCVSTPNFAEMMRDGQGPLTAAEGYALYALNAVRNESRKKAPINLRLPKIKLPSIFRKLLPITMLFILLSKGVCYAEEVSWYSSEACKYNPDKSCPTASGKSLYDLESKGILFAAGWDGKFGTRYRVCNSANGRCVNVVILDRGPAKRLGRKLDLSKAAFSKIAPLSQGIAKCSIQRLS